MITDYDLENNVQSIDKHPNDLSHINRAIDNRSSLKNFVGSVLKATVKDVHHEQNFSCSLKQMCSLMETRSHEALAKLNKDYGDVEGLCKVLKTDPVNGLTGSANDLHNRRLVFGSNTIPPPKSRSFIRLFFDACQDPTLIILLISGFISFGLSFYDPEDSPDSIANYTSSLPYNLSYNMQNDSVLLTSSSTIGSITEKSSDQDSAWIEGAAILVSVAVVALVTAINDFSKEKQYRNLQEKIEMSQTFSVIRGGSALHVPVNELVVGDVIHIKYGDLLPADGVLIQGSDLKVDESSLTGESEHVNKEIDVDPMLLSGTYVMEGSGKMVICAVGMNSQTGIIITLLTSGKMHQDLSESSSSSESASAKSSITSSSSNSSDDGDQQFAKSILQMKLSKLALKIIYCGTTVAVLALLILIIRFIIEHYIIAKEPFKVYDVHFFVKFFIIAVTILVISIPEGLPLAIALALTYSVRKMMHDNNLVRHLDACETMGNATCICSDKTGTLTTNRMTVVQSFVNGKYFKSGDLQPKSDTLTKSTADLLAKAIVVNCAYNSMLIKPKKTGEMIQQLGNKTECGLLGFVETIGFNYLDIRKKYPEEDIFKIYTFNSSRKCMVTIIRLFEEENNVGYRVYQKGASEIVLSRCSYFIDSEGDVQIFTNDEREKIMNEIISEMAEQGLRTICIGYKNFIRKSARDANTTEIPFDDDADIDWDDESFIFGNLTGIAICGIQDPVRPEVPDAIKKCKRAGVTVRMVTGDNINTACAIAKACGILEDGGDYIILEGKDFNQRIRDTSGRVCQQKVDEIWPKLRVLARAQPTDKFNLVKGIIDSKRSVNREIVAVTGDGTNDGPALKKADVGFAMGIAGTDVAKEASDIILTDDNFTSIVKAIMWGRNVYDSISKFIQFQLTVNVVAVVFCFISVCTISDSPLKAVHILWINLIMDTLASLALATERATDELLNRKPYGRKKSLLCRSMLRNILCHAIHQLIILLFLLFKGNKLFKINSGINRPLFAPPTQHFTIIFNTFVLLTLFNEINSRKIHGERNVFKGLLSNRLFCGIWAFTFIAQFFIIQFGGKWFSTAPLNVMQWAVCIALGSSSLLWRQIVILIPSKKLHKKFSAGWGEVNTSPIVKKTGFNLRYGKNMWMRGMSLIVLQLRVVRAFQRRFSATNGYTAPNTSKKVLEKRHHSHPRKKRGIKNDRLHFSS